ncbi:hypothetical protein [Pseudomonas aeruginosa]|uniref:hypothetical protein n=1 Tax=Pseudomonas aeruginosa TaxID=287 RepID=UPI0011C3FE54|nr:hypothetical protein [Pseudomonas aeruginosa]
MFASKQVIVVYPENYEELAIALQHEISKVNGFDSAAWTLEHYKQNMPTLSGRSYVIFIGDAEENRFSKIYLSQISNVVNVNGACFGRDGSKAVVFGEGKLEQKGDFEAFKNNLSYGKVASVSGGAIGTAVGSAFLVAAPLVSVLAVGGAIGGLGYRVVKYFKSKNEAKVLRYEQTKLAIYNFVVTELDAWVGNES